MTVPPQPDWMGRNTKGARQQGTVGRQRTIWWILYASWWASGAFAVLYYPLKDGRVHLGTIFGMVLLLWIPFLIGAVLVVYTAACKDALRRGQVVALLAPVVLAGAGFLALVLFG